MVSEKKTKYLINDTVTINDLNNPFVKKIIDGMFIESDEYDKSYVKNKIFMCSESIYLTMMLSNYFNIPGLCLGIVSNNSHKQEIQKIVNTFLSLF